MWLLITPDDIRTRLAAAEQAAYTTKALAVGQLDPLPELTEQVVREVRGYIAANKTNQLGEGTTIPDELLSAATDIIVFRLTTRLNLTLSEGRRLANDQARALLAAVARGEFAIIPPTNPATAQAASNTIRLVSSRPRIARGNQL